jgi:Leucine-rich repeat (LRR) protein
MELNNPNDILDLNDQDLAELPPLPPNLKKLYCDGNQLTSLPPLPDTLQVLMCGNNRLTELPPLPAGLIELHCERNQLTLLPPLPLTLIELNCDYNQITELPQIPARLTNLNARDNHIIKLINLPQGRFLPKVEIFVDDLNLNSAEIYKQFLDESIREHQERINDDNQTLKELQKRMDMLNLKVVSQGNKQEIQMENGDVIPSGPVNMIKDYMSSYKGGRKTRKNKGGKTRKRKSKNTRKK